MTIKPVFYYTAGFFVAMASCLFFVLSAQERLGDDDYIYNYLGCTPESDSIAIPLMEAVMTSFFWGVVHVISFIIITMSKDGDKNFRLKLGFNKNEKAASWIINFLFYAFALFLLYDYVASFYKFYFFELLSFLAMTATVLFYSLTITNLIGVKKLPE